MDSLFVPFDAEQSVAISTRKLPHWRQLGVTYFITFRLADALPFKKVEQWEKERDRWIQQHPAPYSDGQLRDYHDRFNERIQRWLDAGYGECWLQRPELAEIVSVALRHFDGDCYLLGPYVIMPNHVHLLVSPLGSHELPSIEHSWKSFTAHEINRQLGRNGTVWQKESFDHIVRDAERLVQYEEYIRRNPAAAGLQAGHFKLGSGSGTTKPKS